MTMDNLPFSLLEMGKELIQTFGVLFCVAFIVELTVLRRMRRTPRNFRIATTALLCLLVALSQAFPAHVPGSPKFDYTETFIAIALILGGPSIGLLVALAGLLTWGVVPNHSLPITILDFLACVALCLPLRKLALNHGPAATGFSSETLARGLDTFFRQFTQENFEALLRQDLGHLRCLDKPSAPNRDEQHARLSLARGPELILHFTAGNLPIPALMSMVRAGVIEEV